jgi:hypothetical protein
MKKQNTFEEFRAEIPQAQLSYIYFSNVVFYIKYKDGRTFNLGESKNELSSALTSFFYVAFKVQRIEKKFNASVIFKCGLLFQSINGTRNNRYRYFD